MYCEFTPNLVDEFSFGSNRNIVISTFSEAHIERMDWFDSHSVDVLFEYLSDTGKGNVIPLHAMEAHGVRGGIAPTHS
jgi:hypothetical protein